MNMNAPAFRIAFYARDFEKSVRMYRDHLGCAPVGEGWDRPDGTGALPSVDGTSVIAGYGAAKGKSCQRPSPVAINLAARLEGASALGAFYRQLTGKGVERIEPPQDRIWGHRSFAVHDPDGIPVHVCCRV
jgi:catechol 2,3-dioxygenase-like lactoylglutathione lyase family enzyme